MTFDAKTFKQDEERLNNLVNKLKMQPEFYKALVEIIQLEKTYYLRVWEEEEIVTDQVKSIALQSKVQAWNRILDVLDARASAAQDQLAIEQAKERDEALMVLAREAAEKKNKEMIRQMEEEQNGSGN